MIAKLKPENSKNVCSVCCLKCSFESASSVLIPSTDERSKLPYFASQGKPNFLDDSQFEIVHEAVKFVLI